MRREKSRMVWFEGERPRVEISRVWRGYRGRQEEIERGEIESGKAER